MGCRVTRSHYVEYKTASTCGCMKQWHEVIIFAFFRFLKNQPEVDFEGIQSFSLVRHLVAIFAFFPKIFPDYLTKMIRPF